VNGQVLTDRNSRESKRLSIPKYIICLHSDTKVILSKKGKNNFFRVLSKTVGEFYTEVTFTADWLEDRERNCKQKW
jgi:hypothetical protein